MQVSIYTWIIHIVNHPDRCCSPTASPCILPIAGSVGPPVDVWLKTAKPYAMIVNWRAATTGLWLTQSSHVPGV